MNAPMPTPCRFTIGHTYRTRGGYDTVRITAIEGPWLRGLISGPSYDQPMPHTWLLSGSTGLGYPHTNDILPPLPGHLAGMAGLFNSMVQS